MFQILTILLCFQLYLISCDDLYSKFHQRDYKIEFTRFEIKYYNKDIYSKFEAVTFKYNRSLAVANATFQQKVLLNYDSLYVVMQAYKFVSNEYRIFPVHFQLNLCRVLEQNIGGAFDVISRCGNVRGCFAEKDMVYHICNAYPDESRFPPFVPTGEYKVEVTLVTGNVTVSVTSWYGKVFHPIKY